MSIVLVICSLLLALFIAHTRVKGADEIYKKSVLMKELTESIEKNYMQELESIYITASKVLGCEISDGDSKYLDSVLREKLGYQDEGFFKSVVALSSASGAEISDIIINMKETAKKSKEKALSELNGIKSSAYIFYPGIVFILALLTL